MAEQKTIQVSETLIAGKLQKCNDAIHANDLDAYGTARSELDKELKDFNKMSERAICKACAMSDTPVVEFARIFFFNAKKVTEEKDDDGKILSIGVENTKRRLDLTKFIKRYALNRDILSGINELYALMYAREKGILRMTPVELRKEYEKGNDIYREVLQALADGETVCSNTQICKKLQGVYDLCGVGKRVKHLDIHFLQQSMFNHDSRNIATLKPVNNGKFTTFVMDLLHAQITGKCYELYEKEKKA